MTWLNYNENYSISCYGEVKNKRTNNILKPWNKGKYLAVNIGANNKKNIHKLVALLFLPKIDIDKLEIDHIDRNKHNNSAYNLRWVDKSINNLNKIIRTKPAPNNILNEHHIIYSYPSYYIRITKKNMKINLRFDNLNDAIVERNKIIINYNDAL